MKKRTFIIPLILGLTFALGGCNNTKNDQLLNFIDAEMIDQNLLATSEVNIPNNYVSYDEYVFGPDYEYTLVNDSYIDLGVVVLENNSTNGVGFLDLNNGNNRFGSENASVTIIDSNYLGYYVAINDDTNTYIADAVGNVFFDTVQYLNLTSVVETIDVNGTLSVSLRYYDANSEYKTAEYYYDNDGTIHPVTPETLEGSSVGLDGALSVDLDYLGIEGYNLLVTATNIFYIVNDDGEFVNRIEFDVSADAFCFVNGKFITQKINPLPDDATDYDYFDVDTKVKYELITQTIDIVTGETKTIQIPYVITDFAGLFNDKKGNPVYSIVEICEISPKKTIDTSASRDVLIDGNLNILQYLSEYNPLNFVKLTNGNYYNNSVIYDRDLRPIVILEDETYCASSEVFLIDNGSSFTFVNNDGAYLSNYIDGQIVGQVNDGYFMFTNNNMLYYGQIDLENNMINISENHNFSNLAYTTISSPINNIVYLGYVSVDNLEINYVITSASGEFIHTSEFITNPVMTGNNLPCGLIYNTANFHTTLTNTDTIYHFVLNDQMTFTF